MAESNSTLSFPAADIQAIDGRLQEVVLSLKSIYRLSLDAIDDGDDAYCIAIREMARANIKGICACLDKLTNARMGNFETEFSRS